MNNLNNHKYNLAAQPKVSKLRNDLKARINTIEKVINAKLKTINGLIFRNKGRGLIGVILCIIRGVRPRSSKSVVKQVSLFSFRCYRIAKHSGLKGLVIYLKACQVILQQCVAGYRVLDLAELKCRPARNRAGVPLIIPAGVRVKISRDRDIPSIRLWMTLLGLYRILDFKGTLSLDTITDKGPDLSSFIPEWEDFLENHFKPNLLKFGAFKELSSPPIFPILKSGPISLKEKDESGEWRPTRFTNSSASLLILAARFWVRNVPGNLLLDALNRFLPNIKESSTFIARLKAIAMANHAGIDNFYFKNVNSLSLGKLGFKPEPAGKVRVFAMVDAWTQWLMHPLHEWLFRILRNIPQDGTFDQMAPILRLQSLYADKPKGLFASIDLSAATDRLPISIQVSLLKVLLKDVVPDSQQFAEAWRDILVNRSYKIPIRLDLSKKMMNMYPYKVPGNTPESVHYSVGQPMGALSSWAMLALTHHAMMQYASFKAGEKGWYNSYAVLGDDGVIKGGNANSHYLTLLKRLGVKAGLAKSILSKNKFVIEFAKKFFVDKTTANMLPFKESLATLTSTSLVVEFVRKYELSLNAILSFLGYGYKVKSRVISTLLFKLPTRLRVLLVWLNHPDSPLGKESYKEWLLQKSWSEGFVPSGKALREMIKIVQRLNVAKNISIFKSFQLYTDSLKNLDKQLDSRFPIPVVALTSRMDRVYRANLPWNAILSPEVTSEDIDLDVLMNANDLGNRSQTFRLEELKSFKVGIDIEEVLEDFQLSLEEIGGEVNGFPSASLSHQLEVNVKYYFALDDLKARIPEEFWEEVRSEERPFRDFLTIYKYWQEVTKPLWSEYYKADLSLPEKREVKPLVTNSEIKSERGDSEGLVNHQSSSGSWLNFPWVDFLVMATLTFLMLEFLNQNSAEGIAPFLYNSIVEESELLPPVEFGIESTANYIALGLISSGLLLITGSIIMSYYQGHPWAWLGIYETEIPQLPDITIQTTGLQEIGESVMAGSVMVTGPLSASSLSLVQIRLENQALLDNLAISPIGDLWISPW